MKCATKLLSWIAALRLQFYPMTFLAYAAGALAAVPFRAAWSGTSFWIGYAGVFFVEAATVLTNEYFDFGTDRLNQNSGQFTGGSRVLVESRLSLAEIRSGILCALLLAVICTCILIMEANVAAWRVTALLVTSLFLGIGYTAPPIKLCYRSLGEVDVAMTHSLLMVAAGYAFQGGGFGESLPWLLSLPLFFSILPSIILSGIPDRDADRSVAKMTLAARLGPRGATLLAATFTVISAAVAAVWDLRGYARQLFTHGSIFVVPHAAIILCCLIRAEQRNFMSGGMNLLMVLTLSYIFWFVGIPLLHLK